MYSKMWMVRRVPEAQQRATNTQNEGDNRMAGIFTEVGFMWKLDLMLTTCQ